MLVTDDVCDVVIVDDADDVTDVDAVLVTDVVAEEVTVDVPDDVTVDVAVVCSHSKKPPERNPSIAAFMRSTVSSQSFNPAVIKPSIVQDAVPCEVSNPSAYFAAPAILLIAAAMALQPAPSPPS